MIPHLNHRLPHTLTDCTHAESIHKCQKVRMHTHAQAQQARTHMKNGKKEKQTRQTGRVGLVVNQQAVQGLLATDVFPKTVPPGQLDS